ncbi:MAG: hypothetical protein Q4B32_09610 [Clostridia bacterium]|nr:hypothetical protein [Clostridia bacterium]
MKRYVFLLTLASALCLSALAFAELPTVTVLPEASDIPSSVILDIQKENADAEAITITGWHANVQVDCSAIYPQSYGWSYQDVEVAATGTDQALSTQFVTSVAKGASDPLSAEFTKTVSSSVELTAGNAPALTGNDLDIAVSVTAKIPAFTTLNGPAESSVCNSRQFYVRFYGDTGTWSARAVWQLNPTNRPIISGTWSKPTSWAEYSVDRIIN